MLAAFHEVLESVMEEKRSICPSELFRHARTWRL